MAAAAAPTGRIGPNAITRLAEVLPPLVGSAATATLFAHAGVEHHLRTPPGSMVDEAEVRELHATLRRELGDTLAREAARRAGARTAIYLLGHRIPWPVQALLRVLPPRAAARVLLRAISRHAWTFAGSGRFRADVGRAGAPVRFEIQGNPMCAGQHATAPACDYYAATFEALFRALVHPRARVREVSCEACGSDACRFEIRW